MTKKFETDVKVYRAFKKEHVFFTVFGKPQEQMVNDLIKEKQEHSFEAPVAENDKHKFRVISYASFEEQTRLKIQEEDSLRDTLPDYVWILN